MSGLDGIGGAYFHFIASAIFPPALIVWLDTTILFLSRLANEVKAGNGPARVLAMSVVEKGKPLATPWQSAP